MSYGVNTSSQGDQDRARERQGWLCNWTGSYCPLGCASPCTMKIDRTHTGGDVEVIDYNAKPEA